VAGEMNAPTTSLELLWAWSGPLAMGALSTVGIAVFAYTIGILLGLAGAMGKLAGSDAVKRMLEWYTTLVRSLPELLLIIVLYYLVSDLINQTLALASQPPIRINGFLAAVVVLGFVQGAYHTEVIRGAIQAIHVGQVEAAVAYGMSPWLRFRRVILPAMLPNALPGLTNLWLNVTKDSSLVFVVGYAELISTAKQAAGSATTKHYFLFFSIAAVVYLVISLFSLWGFARIERRVRIGQARASR
jgi:polar amino acid transport system permease protein